jgi:anti-sigma B factor antagonist
MSLKIKTRDIGDITILDCAGRNTLGEGSSVLRDLILIRIDKEGVNAGWLY